MNPDPTQRKLGKESIVQASKRVAEMPRKPKNQKTRAKKLFFKNLKISEPEIVPLDDAVGGEVGDDRQVDEFELEETSVEDQRRKELGLPARPTVLGCEVVVDESLERTIISF